MIESAKMNVIMKKIRKAILLTLVAPLMASFVSCDDVFEPAVENIKNEQALEDLPAWANGVLGHAYINHPLSSWSFNDVATDDAVSNDPDNSYRRMATGAWSATNNPMSNWQHLYGSLQYLNQAIVLADKVEWMKDPVASEMFKMRVKGDAIGMRAYYLYHLLLHQAGWVGNELLGVLILTEPETVDSEFNRPRDTFAACIQQIFDDAETAIELLPEDYVDLTKDADVPAKYKAMGANAVQFTRVFGTQGFNRMSGRIAKAIRAQAALLAASPAYSAGSGVTWETAANDMAAVLKGLGSNPVAELDPEGNVWYASSEAIANLPAASNPKEILWRSNKEENVSIESDNYPPTLFGKGRINPTQNLVDAFPMANGYPITAAASGYDAKDPYKDRDPRLSLYILYNGQPAGPQDTQIFTAADGETNDALNKTETSTRTGYYMKKLLCQTANADPSSTSNAQHYKPYIRYTEIFLGFAEAANEAWGPKGGSHGFTAYDVIKAIRERAGICVGTTDAYLDECAANKDKMRELIRNERRLELCFEGHRFWDLRRWNASLTEAAKGMSITGTDYSVLPNVEVRDYKDYMNYGPLPYGEVIKYSNLLQNDGWN
jgi:hypothetical protein